MSDTVNLAQTFRDLADRAPCSLSALIAARDYLNAKITRTAYNELPSTRAYADARGLSQVVGTASVTYRTGDGGTTVACADDDPAPRLPDDDDPEGWVLWCWAGLPYHWEALANGTKSDIRAQTSSRYARAREQELKGVAFTCLPAGHTPLGEPRALGLAIT